MADYHIYSGMVSSGLTLSNDYMYIYSSGTANYTTVNSGGNIYISSGGTANSTTVNSDGKMYISSGGTANNTTVNGKVYDYASYYTGDMYIYTGGTANNTAVNSGGSMRIDSGGTANSTTVNSGGGMLIYSGGTATKIKENGGYIYVYDGANVTFASNTISGITLSSNDSMTVHANTIANHVTAYGVLEVCSGGIANYTIVDGGMLSISSGGITNNTTVNCNGFMTISYGGIAHDTVIKDGYMYILSGGVATCTTVNSNVHVFIYSGGTATAIKENGGCVNVADGANITFVSNTITSMSVFDHDIMTVHSNTVANHTMVNFFASMCIFSGGVVNYTTVNGGKMFIDGTANDTTVNLYGTMHISSGGIHRCTLQIASGAFVSAYSGSVIDFTVADRKTSDEYLINDLSLINGEPTYTITVSTNQEYGTYKLAQGAINFTGTLTIGNETVDYGSITVNGEDFAYNGVTYSLDQVNGNLTLTITGGKNPAIDNDLDGNGLADTVLVHTKQGFSGAWLTTGDKSVIKWGDLGNVNSKVEVVGMGNVKDTSTNGSDIIMKIGTTVAAWVTDGGKVKSYKELYTLKSNMNMLGIGDFDGDGVTDYLLRSNTGDLGYVTGDDNNWHYIKGLGTEWKIAAVGDLDGNGTDDIIVRHDAGFTGAYMIGTDGKITWSNLDTLKSDMTIVETGDFNGDGVDDVLLQNKSNGWVGAWLVEDGNVDSFIGICKNKNAIEQIADFNGDGIDDLRIRTDKGDIGVLYVKGADTTEWKYFQSVGKEWDTSFALIS